MLSKIKKLLQFRVHRWHCAMGGWKEKDIRVIAVLEEDIWYWALAEYLAENWVTIICGLLHHVKLPKLIREMERHWDKDDPEYFAKFEDWYGDNFGGLWHGYVETPISQFVWKHRNYQGDICLELTLDEARKKFGEGHQHIKWVESQLADHKRYDAEKLVEVRKDYSSGEMTREKALEELEWWFEGENLDALLDGLPSENRE